VPVFFPLSNEQRIQNLTFKSCILHITSMGVFCKSVNNLSSTIIVWRGVRKPDYKTSIARQRLVKDHCWATLRKQCLKVGVLKSTNNRDVHCQATAQIALLRNPAIRSLFVVAGKRYFNTPAFRHCLPSVAQQWSFTSRCLAVDVL
jgi:hypothetical protein